MPSILWIQSIITDGKHWNSQVFSVTNYISEFLSLPLSLLNFSLLYMQNIFCFECKNQRHHFLIQKCNSTPHCIQACSKLLIFLFCFVFSSSLPIADVELFWIRYDSDWYCRDGRNFLNLLRVYHCQFSHIVIFTIGFYPIQPQTASKVFSYEDYTLLSK